MSLTCHTQRKAVLAHRFARGRDHFVQYSSTLHTDTVRGSFDFFPSEPFQGKGNKPEERRCR